MIVFLGGLVLTSGTASSGGLVYKMVNTPVEDAFGEALLDANGDPVTTPNHVVVATPDE